MTPEILAVTTSVAWGAADFIAGLASRNTSVIRVLAWTQPVGLVPLAVAHLLLGQGTLGQHFLVPAAAGIASIVSLALFYLALAKGSMIIVAPIEATGVAVPVAVGLLSGDSLSIGGMVGIGLTALGTVLATQTRRGRRTSGSRTASILAVASAISYGAYLSLLHRASSQDPLVATITMRSVSCGIVLIAYFVCRRQSNSGFTVNSTSMRPTEPVAMSSRYGLRSLWTAPIMTLILIVGLADALAEVCFSYASTTAPLSITSSLSSLYPVVTIGLAYSVLRERVGMIQGTGVGIALLGVFLVSVGQ